MKNIPLVALTALFSTTVYANHCATYYEQKDFDKAFIACNTEAKQGDREAQYHLALMFYNGDGVEENIEKGLYWETKAAEQGYSEAQYNLGLMYHHGDGVKKDIALAKRYFKQACSLGFDKGCDDYNSLK